MRNLQFKKKKMIAQCEVYLALGYTTVYKFCCGVWMKSFPFDLWLKKLIKQEIEGEKIKDS